MSRGWVVVVAAVAFTAGLLCRPAGPAPATWTLPAAEQAPPAQPPAVQGPGGLPLTGKVADLLAPIDEALEKILLRHGVPGAAVAITKDGRLVFARGYGWAHHEKNILSTPETLYGLASVSKCFTALAILKLVEEGKLRLEDKAFDHFKGLAPPPGFRVEPALARITIRQLLHHAGGWDRTKSGDPINWSLPVSQRLGVRQPITEEHLIRYMLATKLDFEPGSRAEYSNFGYIVLGQIVAKVSGQPYEQYVRTKVLEPMGLKAARMHDREGLYFQGEARRYNPGYFQAMPPYNLPWTDSSGGWAASAVELARMMTALDGSRTGKPFLRDDLLKEMLAPPPRPQQPRQDGSHYGLGWDVVAPTPQGPGYLKGGSWPGVRAMVKHRTDGVDTVFLCNVQAQLDPVDMQVATEALREVQEHLGAIKEWPKVDFFGEFR